MHPNPAFRGCTAEANLGFARARGFGMLCLNGPEGPRAAHVPFTLSEAGDVAHLHLVRSNPILAALDAPVPALLAVSGPDGYVSPDWYGLDDQVPTWNYVAVHLRGQLERLPEDALEAVLAELSDSFERRLAPKPAWHADKMDRAAFERMMRVIVPLRLAVASVDGTWKLSQNKPEAVRVAAAGAVETGVGQELAALAALMRHPPAGEPLLMDMPARPA